jgi:hypothetical protein
LIEQKDPQEGPDGPLEFPYNRVRVIGQSPVNHAGIQDEWVGANGQGVVIEPLTAFGSNLDEPYGKLQRLYEVESLPPTLDVTIAPKVKIVGPGGVDPGPSPEDVFAGAANERGEDDGRTQHRRRAAPSPLDPPREPDPEEVAREEALKAEVRRRAGIVDSPLDEGGDDEPPSDS